MKKALLLSLRNSDFTEMFRLARALKASGTYAPLILTYTAVGNDIEFQQRRCTEHGISLKVLREPSIHDDLKKPDPQPVKQKRKKLFSLPDGFVREQVVRVYLFLYHLSQRFQIVRFILFKMLGYFYLFRKQIAQYRHFMDEFKPDILVIAEDIVGLTLPAFIKIGHQHNIPTVIVPYTIANATEAAESLHVYPHYQVRSIVDKIVAFLFPRWIYSYKGLRLLRLPVYFILAHVAFRLSPPDPWTMNSGYANAVAIENNNMKKYYLREGFLEKKLRVTGAIYDDTLTAALKDKTARRAKLYADLNLPADKRLIVVGAPPNQLVTQRPGCPYKDYDTALEDLAILLASLKDYNIILRPHPNFMNMGDVFQKHGLCVTDIDTAELIPLSDIYIAYASATIRWAISCGIPSVNYDLFQYHYDDYKAAPGVLHAYQPEEFNAIVTKLANDAAYYAEIKKLQESVMNDWGHTDGKSANRMIALFDELIAKKPVPRTPTTKPRKN